jgi:Resolvase, N terminal domain
MRAAQAADVASPGAQGEPLSVPGSDPGVLIGYARCSTDKQDLAAQRQKMRQLGVRDDLAISITA